MQHSNPKKKIFKKQEQAHPGMGYMMEPQPVSDNMQRGSLRLRNKKCVITGGEIVNG